MTEAQKKMMEKLGLTEADFAGVKEGEPTQLDRIEAQIMFTALMTDTLIEGV